MRTPTDATLAPAPLALLASPPFILSVALLLLNDHILKAAYGNWLTGKLSDFAGLFAFALFWTALLPRQRRAVFALTAVAFVLWKTPLSDPALAAWNALGILPLARVVDPTDWLALLALVPAYQLAHRHASGDPRPHPRYGRRMVGVASAAVAILAFTATSIARPNPIPDLGSYDVSASRSEVQEALRELSLVSRDWKGSRGPIEAGVGVDTFVVVVRQPPERRVHVWMEVSERMPGMSTMRLVSIWGEGPDPSTESLHRAFAAQVHAPLVARFRNDDPR